MNQKSHRTKQYWPYLSFFEDSTGKLKPSFGKVLAYLQVQFIYTYAHDTVTDCSIVLNSCSWAQIMIHELKVSKSKLVMMRNILKDSMEDHNVVKLFLNLFLKSRNFNFLAEIWSRHPHLP